MTITELDFEKFLVGEYFKYGSINKVYAIHRFNLPISFAGYHRVLTKFGVIKSAGPNSRLSESLYLLTKLSSYKIPLERIYHRYAPQSIQISTNTLHRILHYTRLGLTRRQGTALLISSPANPQAFLIGDDLTLSGSVLGREGDLSLPMSHSKLGENPRDSIIRVLQQEVFTDLVLDQSFPWSIVPQHPRPVMYINIADIKVTVYHLKLSLDLPFSSYKLHRLRYQKLEDLSHFSVRPGVREIITKFLEQSLSPLPVKAPEFNSELNSQLYALAPAKAKN